MFKLLGPAISSNVKSLQFKSKIDFILNCTICKLQNPIPKRQIVCFGRLWYRFWNNFFMSCKSRLRQFSCAVHVFDAAKHSAPTNA